MDEITKTNNGNIYLNLPLGGSTTDIKKNFERLGGNSEYIYDREDPRIRFTRDAVKEILLKLDKDQALVVLGKRKDTENEFDAVVVKSEEDWASFTVGHIVEMVQKVKEKDIEHLIGKD